MARALRESRDERTGREGGRGGVARETNPANQDNPLRLGSQETVSRKNGSKQGRW